MRKRGYVYLVDKELEVIEDLVEEMRLYKKKNNKRTKGSIFA